MVRYYVVLCEDFCSLVPEHWVHLDHKFILWPPKNMKFIRKKMHVLQPDDRWIKYEYRKLLGPFETIEVANQVEEHCTNASTNDDTDDLCTKALIKPAKKRVTKKPARLGDTSEEEAATDDDIGIGAFVPPPSNYQAQQKCDHSAKSVSPMVTVSVSELSLVDVLQHNSILENEKLLSHDVSEELENFDAVFEREIAFASLQVENSPSRHWQNVLATNKDEKQSQNTCQRNKGIVTTKSLTNPCKKKLLPTSIRNECHKGVSLPLKKQRTVEDESSNMQESDDDSKEMDEEQLDDTDQRRLFQQRGNARSCEPLTEERFLKYYKTIMTKLNHVINQLQDHGRPVLNEEVDNLLPDFPLETSEDLEIFNDNLQSADVCKQFVSLCTCTKYNSYMMHIF
ncbi:uncharacterized protein [Linepithema humile]|uniref:uncharacterized protein isoform X1 n=1 Tax=Linepithema humile TaxID=83485 RepID=UPI00351E7518